MTQPAPTTDPAIEPAKDWTAPASQADLDRIINDRLARERAKFADYPELKAKAAKADQLEAANATDLEKAVKAAKAEGHTEAQTAANGRLVKAEARALAAAARFRDPADAVAFLDLSAVRVGDDGEVDGPAVKAALDDLAKSKPYLIDDGKARPAGDIGQGPRTSSTPAGPAQEFADFMNHQMGKPPS